MKIEARLILGGFNRKIGKSESFNDRYYKDLYFEIE